MASVSAARPAATGPAPARCPGFLVARSSRLASRPLASTRSTSTARPRSSSGTAERSNSSRSSATYWSPSAVTANWRTRTVGECSSRCTIRWIAWATSARCSAVRSGRRWASRRSSASTTSSARARSAATVGATSAPRSQARNASTSAATMASAASRSAVDGSARLAAPTRSRSIRVTPAGLRHRRPRRAVRPGRASLTGSRRRAVASAARTIGSVRTGSGDAVAQTTTSTVDSVPASSVEVDRARAVRIGQARGPVGAAVGDQQRSRRRRVTASPAPVRPSSPAPITRAVRPSTPPGTRSSAALTTLCPARSMPVSACTRLPTRRACCINSCISRPTRVVLGGHPVRVSKLAKDLSLADDHGVQSGRDPQGVPGRLGVVVDIEVRREGRPRPARPVSARTAPISASPPWNAVTAA